VVLIKLLFQCSRNYDTQIEFDDNDERNNYVLSLTSNLWETIIKITSIYKNNTITLAFQGNKNKKIIVRTLFSNCSLPKLPLSTQRKKGRKRKLIVLSACCIHKLRYSSWEGV